MIWAQTNRCRRAKPLFLICLHGGSGVVICRYVFRILLGAGADAGATFSNSALMSARDGMSSRYSPPVRR